MLDTWKTYMEAQEFAPNTVGNYIRWAKEMLAFANTENPAKVTPDVMEKWMVFHKEWSLASKRAHYAAVKAFFDYAVKKHAITENPADILPSVGHRKRVDESQQHGKEDKVYTTEQIKALIDYVPRGEHAFGARDRAIIALMAGTGMRASEVAWLNVGNIRKRESSTIFALRKGQSIRKIVVAAFAWKYIDEYLASRGYPQDDDPLFTTSCGNRVDGETIYRMLKRRQKALGLRTGTHNMRYSVLNAVVREDGGNPIIARDIAGQKSIAVTNNYLVSNAEEREAAINGLPWAGIL